MPVTMYTPDGQAVDVPEDQVAEAYKSGQLGLPEGAEIPVMSAGGGNLRTVGLDEFESLAGDVTGVRVATPEQVRAQQVQEGFGDTATAVATGIAEASNMILPGAIDVVGEAVGGEAYVRGRNLGIEANPTAVTAGQAGGVVGSVALAALSGGAGGAGALTRLGLGGGKLAAAGTRLAATTGKGVLSRALVTGAKMAAGGAVEGGVYGAGQALSEAALAGEGGYDNLASKLWAGFESGATGGVAIGGALGVGGSLVASGARKVADKVLGGSARKALREFGETKAVSSLSPKKRVMDQLEAQGRTEKVGRILLDEDIVRAGRSQEETLARAAAGKQRYGKQIGELVEKADNVGVKPNMERFFRAIDDKAAELRSRKSGRMSTMADNLEKEVAQLREAASAGQMTFKELHGWRSNLDDFINFSKQDGLHKELRNVRKEFENAFEESAEQAFKQGGLGEDFVQQYRKAKEGYSAMTVAESALADKVAKTKGSPLMSFGDMMTGAAASGPAGVLGTVAGLATGNIGLGAITAIGSQAAQVLASKMTRKYGSATLATLADAASKVDLSVSKAAQKFMRLPVKAAVREVSTNAARSVDRTLQKKQSESRSEAFERRYREWQSSNSPERQVEKLGKMGEIAPKTAVAMMQRQKRAAAFLQNIAPANSPTPATGGPLKRPAPDPSEVKRWAQALRQVENPLSLLDDLNDGTLSPVQVETMKAVDPGLYEQVRGSLLKEAMNLKSPPPLNRRVALGIFFDIHLDPSTTPQGISQAQEAHAPTEPMVPPSDSPTISVTERTKSTRTQLQQMETGEFQI